ncbi:MAG: tetratricopeptide repeat protein [Bacteroidetes bacterium]|nr:tetratricopeptide repeat protein [Bacteroidota bacterium]
MKLLFRLFLVLALSSVGSALFSQPPADDKGMEEKLAGQYYGLQQYDLAADMYVRLYDREPTAFYYTQLLNCYLQLKDGKSAERLVTKHIKKHPGQPGLLVDLAYVYEQTEEQSKAEKQYERALKEADLRDQRQVSELANAYLLRRKTGLAERTYQEARKQSIGGYSYELELADIYASSGEAGKMLDEYFRLIDRGSEQYIQQIQNKLQDLLVNDPGEKYYEQLRERLLKAVQRNPDQLIFSDLLIWMFVQKKDFGAAVTQSKAIDKRLRESGGRVLQVARIALANDHYEAAVEGFNYLIDKGSSTPVYFIAKKELALAGYEKLLKNPAYTNEELEATRAALQEAYTISTDGESALQLALSLAHLKAFYLGDTSGALVLLDPFTKAASGLPLRMQNEAKLEVADIQLLSGDVWEATLTYSQIEKAMKPDTLSQEAKFRNARLAYYKGDFDWAKAQLDVLKAATSKFIANDAMELSLLIGDNLVYDTTGEALRMFSRADLWLYQNKTEMAMATLDSLEQYFPGSTLADDLLFRKAEIAKRQKNYLLAAELFKKVSEQYGEDILADNALIELARLTEMNPAAKAEAMELYKKLMTEYPGSLYVEEARRRFRYLRGDQIQ